MGSSNYFGGAYQSMDMGLDTMTEGISKEGIENLVEVMQTELLKGVSEKLKETEGITTALKAGWQGLSRDKFLEDMSKAIDGVIADLEAEYSDLMKRLSELVQSYYEQDAKMMELLEK